MSVTCIKRITTLRLKYNIPNIMYKSHITAFFFCVFKIKFFAFFKKFALFFCDSFTTFICKSQGIRAKLFFLYERHKSFLRFANSIMNSTMISQPINLFIIKAIHFHFIIPNCYILAIACPHIERLFSTFFRGH